MKIRFFSLFDYALFVCVLLLTIIGIFFIYSSGVNSQKVLVSNEYIKQIFWAVSGIFLLFLVSLIDYRKIKRIIPWLYLALILVLIYTRLFGRYVNGAKSWIGIGGFGIQPSEFGKIVFILFLAWYLDKSENVEPKKRFFISLVIMLVPMGLILLQPDLGTSSVYIPVFLIMCFFAGIPLRFLTLFLATGVLTVVITVLPIWESEIVQKDIAIVNILTEPNLRLFIIAVCSAITVLSLLGRLFFKKDYYYWIAFVFAIVTMSLILSIGAGKVLKDYQIKRLIVFLDPQTDPLGSGWNIIQSKIAIGSGNIFGQGFLQGTQSHYRFLPQQSTDFIFSILSEETGFVGGLVVFALYLTIILRGFSVIKSTTDVFGCYIASGVCAMIFYHFIVNIGMVMGIMPITGIPLLFLSYGGSSLWVAMMSIGLLESVRLRRLDFH
ncbi:MAG: rod shape-determining protein RodA [Treponemataceae bacterium]|nr:rod shape-determining protein RodA [Treponemataceae bacterium]